MKKILDKYDNHIQRMVEIAIGLITWLTITSPIWASFLIPDIMATFIIIMVVYWFWKSLTYSFSAIVGYLRIKRDEKIDWLTLAKKEADFDQVKHIVLIPNYKEHVEKLALTIDHLAKQTLPPKKIAVVLAMEAREGKEGEQKAQELIKRYKDTFGAIFATYHPEIEGEVAGKSSNQAWAGRKAKEKLVDEQKWDIEYTTISSCDADSLFPDQYFSCLTYKFLTSPERHNRFWQAHIALYSNIDRVILPVELVSAITSVMRLSYSPLYEHFFIPYTTYTASLKLIDAAGYWDVDIIPEDWHMFFKGFFFKKAELKTEAINLTIYSDAIEGENFMDALKNRYVQNRRHAWGVTDIPYYFKQLLRQPFPNFFKKVYILIKVYESHFLWPTSWFLLTLGVNLPLLINPAMKETILGYNYNRISGQILQVTFIFTIIYLVLDRLMNPKPNLGKKWYQKPFAFLKWVLMPIVTLFVSALPGLDAHTRVMLNKKIEYVVAPKKIVK